MEGSGSRTVQIITNPDPGGLNTYGSRTLPTNEFSIILQCWNQGDTIILFDRKIIYLWNFNWNLFNQFKLGKLVDFLASSPSPHLHPPLLEFRFSVHLASLIGSIFFYDRWDRSSVLFYRSGRIDPSIWQVRRRDFWTLYHELYYLRLHVAAVFWSPNSPSR